MFESLTDAEVIDTITGRARASAIADAERYSAIAELQRRRCTGDDERRFWACDDWDGAAAELSAALNIGHGRASGEMDLAVALRDRLPRVGALFHAGVLNGRRVWLIEQRTAHVTDPETLAALDEVIADRILGWGPLSEYKLTMTLDAEVEKLDPAAVRRVQQQMRARDFVVGTDHESGTTAVWGRLSCTDAALTRTRVDTMVRSVCADDPRTLKQRRADAVGAVMAGSQVLSCQCGNPACPAVVDDGRASSVVVHVITDQASVEAADADPALHGPRDADEDAQAERSRRRPVAVIPGHGVVPGPLLAELIARGARITPVLAPTGGAEPRYRPSTALDRFVRVRDLTCRAPGCDRPAEFADIDHTVPYPAGATHAGGVKCYCRKHHLVKTFHAGWSDRQLADGTVVVTTPTGHTYTTTPGIALLFPTWNVTTPAPPSSPVEPGAHRSIMMPRRKRTRAQAKADRIKAERALNERADPPPF
ncbi:MULTISPECIES: HNH endonuclease signature motif containing protein [unclassified Mycobacterium]|uniref:HNH endonuclease signature motif containing protein n=1 Tax=unclassified Mycobacterium TaxID=2642494 RepID=UPI0029C7D5D2|nr:MULTISPECIES: DUF222 domain-containing protein [unclassified Mycobacterium]